MSVFLLEIRFLIPQVWFWLHTCIFVFSFGLSFLQGFFPPRVLYISVNIESLCFSEGTLCCLLNFSFILENMGLQHGLFPLLLHSLVLCHFSSSNFCSVDFSVNRSPSTCLQGLDTA
uniref:Uncharacterized protein n=1 Tax=Cacopsylla melanoneura TaxID=428564 RepID=A0A8D8RUP3_9HEMI